jgi:hypothetical protein
VTVSTGFASLSLRQTLFGCSSSRARQRRAIRAYGPGGSDLERAPRKGDWFTELCICCLCARPSRPCGLGPKFLRPPPHKHTLIGI